MEAGSLAGGVTGSASGRQSCRQTSLHATGIDAFSELLNRKESEVENMRLKKTFLADGLMRIEKKQLLPELRKWIKQQQSLQGGG